MMTNEKIVYTDISILTFEKRFNAEKSLMEDERSWCLLFNKWHRKSQGSFSNVFGWFSHRFVLIYSFDEIIFRTAKQAKYSQDLWLVFEYLPIEIHWILSKKIRNFSNRWNILFWERENQGKYFSPWMFPSIVLTSICLFRCLFIVHHFIISSPNFLRETSMLARKSCSLISSVEKVWEKSFFDEFFCKGISFL